jgi:hypothetical protein
VQSAPNRSAPAASKNQYETQSDRRGFIRGGGPLGGRAGVRGHLLAITGAPYSADKTIETVQAGVRVTEHAKEFRDSEGRLRHESQLDANGMWKTLEIEDLVAGYRYRIEAPWTNVVNRWKIPGIINRMSASELAPLQHADVGTQTIAGLTAYGVRHAIPRVRGFDQTETWTAPEPMIVLLTRSVMPTRETVTQVTNLVRAEPDPALFQFPKDFFILDTSSTTAPR